MSKENEAEGEEEVIEVPEIVEDKDENGADITDWKAEALRAQGIARRFKTKLEKAKEKKTEEVKKEEVIPKDTSTDTLSREEVVMIAKGTDEDDLAQLKVIQKGMGEGATLKQASESPLYQGYIGQKNAEEKRRKAQLGAGSGGGARDEDKINKPELSREEHKALWEKENK